MTDPLLNQDLPEPETDEAQAATKAAVFNAAERLFALHGFQNVSVRDITADLPPIFEAVYADSDARTCNACGHMHPGKG